MNGKVLLGVLAVIGTLALSGTVAHAGGRGNPTALTSFFVCHTINAGNLGVQVDAYSDEAGSGVTRKGVTLGQALLACAQAKLFPAGTETPIPLGEEGANEIDPTIPGVRLESLKCYQASVSKKTGETGVFNIEDSLFGMVLSPPAPFGTEESVVASRDPKYICGPANLQ